MTGLEIFLLSLFIVVYVLGWGLNITIYMNILTDEEIRERQMSGIPLASLAWPILGFVSMWEYIRYLVKVKHN